MTAALQSAGFECPSKCCCLVITRVASHENAAIIIGTNSVYTIQLCISSQHHFNRSHNYAYGACVFRYHCHVCVWQNDQIYSNDTAAASVCVCVCVCVCVLGGGGGGRGGERKGDERFAQ